jgi:endoglucanase
MGLTKQQFNDRFHGIVGDNITVKAKPAINDAGAVVATGTLIVGDIDTAINKLYDDALAGTSTTPTTTTPTTTTPTTTTPTTTTPTTTTPTNSVGSDGDLKDLLNVAVDFSQANVKLPTKPVFTVNLSSKNNASYSGLLVDIEAYNAAGVKVGQVFVQDKAIQAGSTTKVVLEMADLPAGTFSTKVLIFNQPVAGSYAWGTKRFGTENAGSFQLAPADVYVPPAGASPFYRAPQTVNQYVSAHPELKTIADQPQGVWLGNEWVPDPQARGAELATAAAGERLLLVIYAIPDRDSGQYSAGGLTGGAAYKAWIDKLALGVGTAPVTYILEPDALGLLPNLASDKQTERKALLKYAIASFKKNNPNAKVYCDASTWVGPQEMAQRLADVNPGGTTPLDGFSCNVSGYDATQQTANWAGQVSQYGNGLHWVIDTSRNGKGGTGEWCNPLGRGLGKKPTLTTGITNCDAFLWIKAPGESDGTCNGGPSAGTFWLERAQELITNAVF